MTVVQRWFSLRYGFGAGRRTSTTKTCKRGRRGTDRTEPSRLAAYLGEVVMSVFLCIRMRLMRLTLAARDACGRSIQIVICSHPAASERSPTSSRISHSARPALSVAGDQSVLGGNGLWVANHLRSRFMSSQFNLLRPAQLRLSRAAVVSTTRSASRTGGRAATWRCSSRRGVAVAGKLPAAVHVDLHHRKSLVFGLIVSKRRSPT